MRDENNDYNAGWHRYVGMLDALEGRIESVREATVIAKLNLATIRDELVRLREELGKVRE